MDREDPKCFYRYQLIMGTLVQSVQVEGKRPNTLGLTLVAIYLNLLSLKELSRKHVIFLGDPIIHDVAINFIGQEPCGRLHAHIDATMDYTSEIKP